MNEVEEYKKELADEIYCDDHYGEGCDGDCAGCRGAALQALTGFENLVRTDERTKTLKECKEMISGVFKYYRDEYHFGVTFNIMCSSILDRLEELTNRET